MEHLTANWPQLADYHLTIVALTLLTIAVLIQNFLAGVLGLAPGDEIAGMPLKGDHEKRSFRIIRTYQNSVENLPMLIAAVIVALLAGVSPFWVNLLVWVHVLLRLVYWPIYYAGIGKIGGGIRTIVFAIAMFANLILALLALFAILF